MAAIEVACGPAVDGVVVGTVAEFDPSGHQPGGRWFFHCTAIVDGTRTIAAGAEVQFEVAPGRMGRFEARDLRRRT
jgi:cold shock CspA family protein